MARNKPNHELKLITPFKCGDTSWYLPNKKESQIRVCDGDVTYVVPTQKEEGGEYVASRESRSKRGQ